MIVSEHLKLKGNSHDCELQPKIDAQLKFWIHTLIR